jgi:alpha-beta hydrolase superfamily lysophospholipase
MLSLQKLANRGINKVLLPLLTVISMFMPTLPLAETARNTKFPHSQREVEIDPLTWPSGLKRTRCRVAAEYWLGTQRIQKRLHEMNIPFIAFHGRDDPMTDPESSAMLFREAACEDKSLEWVDNVFHDLMHEKPTSDRVIESIVEWIGARIDGPVKPAAKKPKRAAPRKEEKSAPSARVTRARNRA